MQNQRILIGLAGGSGSGKTSVTQAITKKFDARQVVLMEQDAYYKDLSDLPLAERLKTNVDHPDSIDFSLLKKHIQSILKGDPISVPIYDYKTLTRSKDTHQMESHHIVFLEGIFALYDKELRDLMDIKIYVDTADDLRFIRRLTRDIKERGGTLDSVIARYCDTVRPMHLQFIEPTKRYADIIIPDGVQNKVAIDLVQTKIKALLDQRSDLS